MMTVGASRVPLLGRHLSGLHRRWLAWRFRLFQRHRHRRLTLEHVDGMPILVLPEVFNPTLFFSSEALARLLPGQMAAGDAVLDMGTGSGIQAVTAAGLGARVVAVDVAEAAVRCARINVLMNGVESEVDVRQGDLFAPVQGERFDLVLFNPPFYTGRPREEWELAWRSEDVLERFGGGLSEVLNDGGRALLVVSSDVRDVDDVARRHGLRSRVLWQRNMISERILILEWAPEPAGGPA